MDRVCLEQFCAIARLQELHAVGLQRVMEWDPELEVGCPKWNTLIEFLEEVRVTSRTDAARMAARD